MARRRKKRRGRKSKSIAVLPTVAAVMPAVTAYDLAGGINKDLPGTLLYAYTGYAPNRQVWDSSRAMATAIPFVGAVIAHKLATRTGVNRMIKKATFGYLVL